MEEIKKVAILGAGAMGAYFAGTFFDTAGFSTVLIAKRHPFRQAQNQGLNNKREILYNPGHPS